MSTQPNHPPRVVFGAFEFDGASGELLKNGTRLRLQGQPQRILALLLDHPGQVLTRDELQRELWNGTTFVDFEHGLNAAINKLRQTLGDSADRPRYVETLPGRGYRFIGQTRGALVKPVLEMAPLAHTETKQVETKQVVSERAWPVTRWLPWSLGAALLVALAGGYWMGVASRASSGTVKPTRFSVFPPPGYELEPASSRQAFALSPDGTRLAFAGVDVAGAAHILLRDFDTLEPRVMPDSAGSHTMFWTPDSRSLFVAVRGKLRRVPWEGAGHQVVCDSPAFLLGGAFIGPDKILLSSRPATYLVGQSGGTPETLKEAYIWPQVLPDGDHILSVRFDSKIGRYRAQVARFGDSEPPQDLIEADSRVSYAGSTQTAGAGYLLYVRAGNLLAQPFDARSLSISGEPRPVASRVYSFHGTGAADFSVSERGTLVYQSYVSRSQLTWVDREGHRTTAISPPNVNVKEARMSPDGQKIATAMYDVERGVNDIWIFDSKSGTGHRAIPGMVDAPVWSPDSKKLAFLRAGARFPELMMRGLEDSDTAEVVVPGDDFRAPTDWSRDGRFIAFENTAYTRFASEQQGDVWLVDLANNRKLVPLIHTPAHEANGVFSPDGKWIAFTSDESGQTEVYLQAFEAGDSPRVVGPRKVASRGGALSLRWRADGKELFYLSFDGHVHAVPVTLGPRLEVGMPSTLFEISNAARAAVHSFMGFDVASDGQRFAIPVVAATPGPSLVVIQNWEAALGKAAR